LKFLLEQGQGLLVKTESRHSPLMRALIVGREETAMFMLEHAAQEEDMITDRGSSSYLAIHFAAESGCSNVMEN
jgi:ankyrin repeat protein